MDFVALTSDRSGLLLRNMGQRLHAHLDAVSSAPSGDGFHAAPPRGDCQELVHHQKLHQVEQRGGPLFPLGHTPEDVRPDILSFLPARELASIRRVSRGFLLTADLHAETLWSRLCRHDFPSMTPPPARVGGPERAMLSPHQQYVKNVLHRAIDEAGNLRANHRLRESLDNFAWPLAWPAEHGSTTIYSAITSTLGNSINNSIRNSIRGSSGTRSNDGVVGLLSDLVTVPDPRIARALSHKRRAAMSTVVVKNDDVVFDFRRRGIHTGPVNFLPLSTLLLENPTPLVAPLPTPLVLSSSGGGGDEGDEGGGLLPLSPETPAPAGFIGYAVRLLQLRPEHESLRWTVLFAVFKDLVVFETTQQAEALRARVPDRRLFYCALDHPGAQDDPCPPGGRSLPHISHWRFQGELFGKVGGGDGGGGGGGGGGSSGDSIVGRDCVADTVGSTWETVGDAVERQERTACFARSSLAFLQYGGGGGVGRSSLA
eukprot:g12462.t1